MMHTFGALTCLLAISITNVARLSQLVYAGLVNAE